MSSSKGKVSGRQRRRRAQTMHHSDTNDKSMDEDDDGNNQWNLGVAVMGCTPKQRSIYINTWLGFKSADKKKQASKTQYGQAFHIKHASPSMSIDLYVHEIEKTVQLRDVWDSIILNIIVLPYNHDNASVDKPLRKLIHDLNYTNIPVRTLFNKTLLICPSTFANISKEQYIEETTKGLCLIIIIIYSSY